MIQNTKKCVGCGVDIDNAKHIRCVVCRCALKLKRKRRKAKRAAAGLCVDCGRNEISCKWNLCVACHKHRIEYTSWSTFNDRERRRSLRRDAINAYGGYFCACQDCPYHKGAHDYFLCIDHVGGGGGEHRRAIKKDGHSNFYQWLKKNSYPPGFQVLCTCCNMAKERNGGVCPHVKDNSISSVAAPEKPSPVVRKSSVNDKVAFESFAQRKRRELIEIEKFIREIVIRPMTINEIIHLGKNMGFKPWNRDRFKDLTPHLLISNKIEMVSKAIGPHGATYISTMIDCCPWDSDDSKNTDEGENSDVEVDF